MTVNARWRLTFRYADGDAYRVAIEGYHRGYSRRVNYDGQEYERIPVTCSERSCGREI